MKDFGLKKLYYSISEVSKITGLEQYILRYWENEFDQLKPSKNRAGNRIYTNKEIKLIIKIKKLLRDEKYTIEGAKKILLENLEEIEQIGDLFQAENIVEVIPPAPVENIPPEVSILKDLEEIKKFLLDLKGKL
ncbi:MAG: MerR family transcriptional regulator [Ignavibacteriales bacterium]|nr:MerR family transcriptional regulator [Melioribacteraceae bacterium]MCF8435374.1 MerR family transcriptional regulator [Ignavibacteriales bacterium]